MRISILFLAVLCVCLPFAAYAQQADASNSLQDNGKDGDLDAKNDDPAAAGEDDKDKPRKKTFTEERFEKLFSNRRSKPRLLTPKYHEKPKPKLPSFIKKPPSIKPLGQDGLPVDDEPRLARTTPPAKPANARAGSRTSTTTPSTRTRGRTSTSTTTQRPSLSDSNRRFNLSPRGRGTDTSSSNPAISRGRGRIN